ncbi:SphA family protein [Methylobacterium nonmethylotrophicum]|nr:transporter [Methylobacterium nonmethylotrophicum]
MTGTPYRLLLAALILPLGGGAQAFEGGTSAYLKGFRDFMSGYLPQEPGLSLREDIYVYGGRNERTLLSGRLQLQLDTQVIANIVRPTFVTPWTILGANYGVALSWAQPNIALEGQLQTPLGTVGNAGERFGIGDVALSPIVLGWHAGSWHMNAAFAVYLPVGDYDVARTINAGNNYWAVSPQVGVTYFDPQTGWDLSVATVYVTSWENPATRYESGDALHVDFAVGKQVSSNLKLGIVGYGLWQVSDDAGAGARLGPNRARVYGLGPALTYSFKVADTPVSILGKYYREFGERNTFVGNSGTISVSVRF